MILLALFSVYNYSYVTEERTQATEDTPPKPHNLELEPGFQLRSVSKNPSILTIVLSTVIGLALGWKWDESGGILGQPFTY